MNWISIVRGLHRSMLVLIALCFLLEPLHASVQVLTTRTSNQIVTKGEPCLDKMPCCEDSSDLCPKMSFCISQYGFIVDRNAFASDLSGSIETITYINDNLRELSSFGAPPLRRPPRI